MPKVTILSASEVANVIRERADRVTQGWEYDANGVRADIYREIAKVLNHLANDFDNLDKEED
jgi:hypothetical protein